MDLPDRGEPEAEVVASATDAPRVGERLASAVRRAGLRSWARRHRMLLAGVTSAVVVVVAGGVYLVNRPPPVDPVVHVAVAGFASGASVAVDDRGGWAVTADYQVTTLDTGDVTTPTGIIGPGLAAPTSSITKVEPGTPGLGRLGATVDCSDARWWDATETDYRARVVRTDAYGRVTTYDAPLGDSPLGPVSDVWRVLVRQLCLFDVVQRLPPADATGKAAGAGDRVDVSVTVTNPGSHALRLSAEEFDDARVRVHSGPTVVVPPGGTAELTASMQASDCSNGPPRVATATTLQGDPTLARGVYVHAYDDTVSADAQYTYSWVRLDQASVTVLDRQLSRLCPRD